MRTPHWPVATQVFTTRAKILIKMKTVTGSPCPGLGSQSKDPTHTDTETVTRGSITKGKCRYKSKMRGTTGSVVVSTSACHFAGHDSIPGLGALSGVQTWLSTLEIVYLCVFRKRHLKPLVPSMIYLVSTVCQGKKKIPPVCTGNV